MVNGLRLYSAFLTSGHSKRCTILANIHPFMHTFTHRRRCQTRKATAGSTGAVRVRHRAQGHPDTLGIELATFRLPADPLYLLSHLPSEEGLTYKKHAALICSYSLPPSSPLSPLSLAPPAPVFPPSPPPSSPAGSGEGVGGAEAEHGSVRREGV